MHKNVAKKRAEATHDEARGAGGGGGDGGEHQGGGSARGHQLTTGRGAGRPPLCSGKSLPLSPQHFYQFCLT